MDSLKNYRQLVARVDEICQRIETDYRPYIACHKGCDGCCLHLSLFWVEGVALVLSLAALPEEEAEHIRALTRQAAPEGPCPLLEEGVCLLYAARPIICRTHGLPLLIEREGESFVDYCPENFQGFERLPGADLIDLDQLNSALATINALFVADVFGSEPPQQQRITIAEALLMDLEVS